MRYVLELSGIVSNGADTSIRELVFDVMRLFCPSPVPDVITRIFPVKDAAPYAPSVSI
jgi:hypothetical protein